MKKSHILHLVIILFVISCQQKEKSSHEKTKSRSQTSRNYDKDKFENGDIIFQTSLSSQSKAIQIATNSEYSHCGIIFDEGQLLVYEAVQPVKMTPLQEWIARGKNGKFILKRLKNPKPLENPENYKRFCDAANVFFHKDYDLAFDWSDDKGYCSEVVWKTYKNGLGIELCKLEHLKDFNLSNPAVKAKLAERYGNKIPYNQLVISPKAIFESKLLETVKQN
jgi:hypothetical protein